MSLKTLESAITVGARTVLNNRKLRVKDLMEWSTSEITAQDAEVVVFVPDPGVYVAVKAENDKRVK
jgi:hypothetical protein